MSKQQTLITATLSTILIVKEREFTFSKHRLPLANSGMSTASLGENALANSVTVFGGFLFEVIATFLFVLVIMTVTSESKGNGAVAGFWFCP